MSRDRSRREYHGADGAPMGRRALALAPPATYRHHFSVGIPCTDGRCRHDAAEILEAV